MLGLIGMYMRVSQGHLPAGYGSYVPWGLWIAVYFHGVGIAAGAFVASAVGYLLQVKGFRSTRVLQVASVVVVSMIGPALLAVGLDLGHMTRAWRIIVGPSFTSMMAFNTFAYIILLAIAAVVWFLARRPANGWLKPFLILGSVVALMVPSQSGAFFGVVDSKPFWSSALLPPMLLVSALVAGSGILMIVHRWLGDEPLFGFSLDSQETREATKMLRIWMLVGLAMYLVFEFAEYSLAFWSGHADSPAVELILFGPYWWSFWIVHLVFGVAIPVTLLLTNSHRNWVIAAALVAVTMLSGRLNVLIPGQAVAEIQGLQEAFHHPRLDYIYIPTLMEYLVCFFCLALALGIFGVGMYITARVTNRREEGTRS
ncbi:NrfD/PsrC family molybdoenzyme membrane anchor subunit [Tessaracoccus sp. G1721]